MNTLRLQRPAIWLMLLGLAALVSQLPAEPYAGYTLFGQLNGRATNLLDMNERNVHTWNHNRAGGYSAYLLENGHLLRTANADRIRLNGGGAQGVVQEIDWAGNVVWQYTYSSETVQAHHDIEPLPNGNVLMIAWEVKTAAQAQAAGLNRNAPIWPDHIIEVQPNGANGGNIVWEWHAWDHLIQDFNRNRANFGVVADHPELLDINLGGGGGGPGGGDWMHVNGISYNPDLDQIVISSHNLNEIWVIDHSTTTAEAAGHQGGRWGRGGDFLYRWGRPANYDAPGNQVFNVVHCGIWVPAGMPGAGNIMAFNNRQGQGTSMIVEIVPPRDDQGNYVRGQNGAYGPAQPVWTYTANGFYSNHLGGCHRLPNGNTFIVESTAPGYLFEVDARGNVQWDHNFGREVARGLRYAEDYPGVYALHPVAAGDLVINEILALNDTTAADQDGETDGWIELFNPGEEDISLWGFYLGDNADNLTQWRFPDTTLAAGEYMIVWMDGDRDQAGLHAGFELAAQGGRIILSAPNRTILDNIQFPEQSTDISYGRYPNGAGQFRLMTPSFEAENLDGVQGPRYEVVINEFQAENRTTAPDQDGEFQDWIELFNPAEQGLSLAGCYLSDDIENPTKWVFPDTAIAGRGYLVVWADEDVDQSGLHSNFRLPAAGGRIMLLSPNRMVLDEIVFGVQATDLSFGRYPNGEGDFRAMTPSPGAPNHNGVLDPGYEVAVNEFLVDNRTIASDPEGEYEVWIELFNNREESLSLNGFYLSDDADDLRKWSFPDISLAGQFYAIVWADQDIQQEGLHANFELTPEAGRIYLTAPPYGIIDSVEFAGQTADISYGRYPNGTGDFKRMTPSLGAENHDGILNIQPPAGSPPLSLELTHIYPNPFNPSTIIGFQLAAAGEVRLAIFNTLGQCVAVPVKGIYPGGRYEAAWAGRDERGGRVNSGIYYCILESDRRTVMRKVVLLR